MKKPNTWYHGTSEDTWSKIQEQGQLLGRQGEHPMTPMTYLASDVEEARCYGPVVLKVEYQPGTHPDNYVDDCWQMRVYGPIPLASCTRLNYPQKDKP